MNQSEPQQTDIHPIGDAILRQFLEAQFSEGMALAASSDILQLQPLGGSPPQKYIAQFACKGLVQDQAGEIVEFDRFDVGIWFPDDYLRSTDIKMVATYLGPSPRPWHPNIQFPFLCLHIKPGTSLVDILYGCFELFTWNLVSTGDEGLNHAAAQWARHQDPSRFPIDRRPLKRRKLELQTSPASEEGTS